MKTTPSSKHIVLEDWELIGVQATVACQKAALPVDFLEHHFFFVGVLVCDFEDAEPEIFCEILPALGVQISNACVPTVPAIGVV
ncbi:hypothetical protein [Pseudomonas syringae]|uniref:hypothetical protein n=1 Tax=Pseudomonas syringae TaxID=317 RepID=UPI0015C4C04C|nr:hypothetical protein [Pseudomonas syringae]